MIYFYLIVLLWVLCGTITIFLNLLWEVYFPIYIQDVPPTMDIILFVRYIIQDIILGPIGLVFALDAILTEIRYTQKYKDFNMKISMFIFNLLKKNKETGDNDKHG